MASTTGTGTRGASPERRLLGHDPVARRWLLLAATANAGATVALLAQLVVVALVVGPVFLEGEATSQTLPLLALAVGLAVLRAGLAVVAETGSRQAAGRLVGTLRTDLTDRVLRLGPTWTSRERTGEVTSVLVGGLEAIDEYVATFLPARWQAMVVPLLVLVLVLLLDPPSVLVLLFTGPLLLLLLAVIGGRTRAISERRFLELRALSAFFLDILRGIPTLKLFGRSREQADNLRRISSRYGEATMEVLRTAFQTSLVLEWGATIAIALVAVEVGLRLLDGAIDFERALAVLLVTPEFFLPLRALATRYHVGSAGVAAGRRVFEIFDQPSGGTVHPVPPSSGSVVSAMTEPPRVTFEGVRFTYPGREAPALDGVTLELRPRESVALVGASGAGKSTLSHLLLRFVEPDAGQVSVDGRPLDEVSTAAWRASLAWVPQRPHLFTGSIADNVRLARPGAGDEAVTTAVRAANAAEFIERLPAGLDTAVGEGGARLSGGQRQRVAIARAFLRDAPLLILDEVTAHQDEASEAAIADAVERLSSGRTVLVIAHRLRLAQRADRVVVLEGGRVLEDGPPARLLGVDGPFRRLLEAGEGSP